MTITSIRQIRNEAGFEVEVVKPESNQRVRLESGASAGTDIWIPWCVSEADFQSGHFVHVQKPAIILSNDVIDIIPPKVLFTIWQKDNQVSFALGSQWVLRGKCVPINCATGGDRLLTIRGSDVASATIEISKLL